jgi:hypothetical protein
MESTIKGYFEAVFKTSGFASLATEGNGQPHTSLLPITPVGNELPYQAHMKQHPEMESFLLSADCALILVITQ